MTRSASDMMRSGAVSTRAYNSVLAQTKNGVPTKMAKFNSSKKDEAGTRDKGHTGVASREAINQNQRLSSAVAFGPTARKGGKQRRGQPTSAHINREQGPLFPSGGYEQGGPGNKTGNVKMKGPVRRTGGVGVGKYYGGPVGKPAEGG